MCLALIPPPPYLRRVFIAVELKESAERLLNRREPLLTVLKFEALNEKLHSLREQLRDETLWSGNRLDDAQRLQRELRDCERALEPILKGKSAVDNLRDIYEFCKTSELSETDEVAWTNELTQAIANTKAILDDLELQAFFSEPMDANNAIVTIHAGAGGTEACDWANMVLRMYTRWAERKGFSLDLQALQTADEAGISGATFRVLGLYAYGYLKAERGVHRLVRLSPFDANHKRHTSFCAVDVVAELNDDIEVPINERDIRIDVFRSSGAGGQHVNKTESAVRITHFPTGIVVTCQNDRSQIKNRASAMAVLKARLYERMQDEKRSAMERFYGEKGEIGWGYQIRSYVFQPYRMVKDLRTNVETADVQGVMDGDLDKFMEAWLRAGKPRMRS